MRYFPQCSSDRVALLLVLIVATTAAAAFTKDSWDWMLGGGGEASTQGVEAPELSAIDDETERLYRVAPDNGSAASYTVIERLAGSEKTTTGTSSVIAGDIVVDTTNRTNIRVGEVVVNVEMFSSDSNLRDKRLRHDFIESTQWPFARFVTTAIDGLPESFSDGATVALTLHGDLTLKETTAAASFSGEVTITESQITATVSATVLGSDFGIGPINIARLAHTSDEIVLTFDLVADRVDLADASDPNSIEQEFAAPPVARGAFVERVQPILETRCVFCHTSGGPGSRALALDTVVDAALIAEDIAMITGAGYMPPWLPSDQSPLFHNDWSLSDTELATLADWAGTGGGLDVSPNTPLVARAELIHPVERDLETYADKAYVGSLDRPDDYRCQIHRVDDPEGDGTWIKGFSFEPDETSVVHHAITYRAPASAMDEARRLNGSDGQPGWTCFGLSGMQSNGVYAILGWAPGQSPTLYPDGIGVYLEPGDFIVNQIHYHFDHETPADSSGVILDVATAEEVAAGMRSIRGRSFLTPAEMPCTLQEQATGAPLCDREAVLDDIANKYGPSARAIPDLLLLQCGGTVDDYDDLDGTIAHSSCDLESRLSGTIFSVLGHMHEFGAAYRMTLNPGTADEQVLLDIPVWSFEWQLSYEPVEAITIEDSDTVRLECTWDRSLVFLDEPRYVTWNEGTVDEMCFSTIRVIPN